MFRRTALAAILSMVMAQFPIQAAVPNLSSPYLIHLKYTEATDGADEHVKVLAASTLATVENRESTYLIGGEKTLGDQHIPYGTQVQLRIRGAGDNAVTIQGTIELSAVDAVADDVVARKTTAIHFNRRVELGKNTEFELPDAAGNAHTISLQIETVTALDPAAANKSKPKSDQRSGGADQ